MTFLGRFKKRYELPEPPAAPGEMRQTLTQEARRGQIELIKQVEQSYNLRNKINEALSVLAQDALETVRKG